MSALLKIRDEFFGSARPVDQPSVELKLASERVSPREIIRQRICAEVESLNEQRISNASRHERTRSFLVDVEEDSSEQMLNRPLPWRKRVSPLLDVDEEFEKAIAAFRANRFVMLFDDRQVESLEDDLTVMPGSEVIFLHITPLKGG